MTLWIALTVIMFFAAMLVAVPLLRRRSEATAEGAPGVSVYKDQLEQLEQEKQDGLIGKEEADLARVEIERRLITAGKSSDQDGASTLAPAWHIRAVVAACSVVAFGSVGLYAAIGSPQLAGQQVAPTMNAAADAHQQARTMQVGAKQMSDNIGAMVKRLEEKLKAEPNNADGWRVLGWSYYNMERYADAAEAYRKAVELKQDSAILKSLYGEALVKTADGKVTPKAKEVFEATLAINPDNVRARYFTGLEKDQNGDTKGAIDAWIALLKLAPAGVEWAQDLRKQIVARAEEKGIEVKDALPPEDVASASAAPVTKVAEATPQQKGPTAEDIKAAEEMAPEDRMAMVRGMVDRLANRLKKSPDDPDGWIQLMRSRLVLQDRDAAMTALSDAMTAFADKPDVQSRIKSAAAALGLRSN